MILLRKKYGFFLINSFGGAIMAKGDNLLKILYIMDILRENRKKHSSDDKGRFLSANELVRILD